MKQAFIFILIYIIIGDKMVITYMDIRQQSPRFFLILIFLSIMLRKN